MAFIEDDEELLAPVPAYGVAGSYRLLESGGDFAEDLVSNGMAEAVVDALEVVYVAEHHGELAGIDVDEVRGQVLKNRAAV